MHRPVAAPFAVFTGSIERVDDPHSRAVEPRHIVGLFFRKQSVIGAQFAQRRDQQGIRLGVARAAQRRPVMPPARAHLQQDAPGPFGEMRG